MVATDNNFEVKANVDEHLDTMLTLYKEHGMPELPQDMRAYLGETVVKAMTTPPATIATVLSESYSTQLLRSERTVDRANADAIKFARHIFTEDFAERFPDLSFPPCQSEIGAQAWALAGFVTARCLLPPRKSDVRRVSNSL